MITKENCKRTYLLLGIFIIIGVLIKICVPAAGALTTKGVTYLAILLPTILAWTFLDTGWPSLLCMAALIMCQVLPAGTVIYYHESEDMKSLIDRKGLKKSGFNLFV